jgi:TonB family protein
MDFEDEYEERGFFKKYGFAMGIGAVGLVIGGLIVGQVAKADKTPVRRTADIVMVKPLPAPPPPPPPKVQEPPKEVAQKMIEQTPVDEPEQKPDDSPKDAAPALTTGLTGSGSDGFGLGVDRGGRGFGNGGGGGGPRSRFGWFAGEVQKTIQDALSRNRVTNMAQFTETARIWADSSGRVTRVKLQGSTGDAALDRALEETLTGLQLQDAPPADMPMPIVMRLRAHRPG